MCNDVDGVCNVRSASNCRNFPPAFALSFPSHISGLYNVPHPTAVITDFIVAVVISVASMEVWLHHTSSSGALLHADTKTKAA